MADLDSAQKSHLHPGVDPESWLGFEQRIQARRYDALLASARAALESGNVVLAEHALEEAREMRPGAPELLDLEAQVAVLTTPPGHNRELWRRGASALALLLVGVSMFIALDTMRLIPATLPSIAPLRPQLLESATTIRTLEMPALSAPLAAPLVNVTAPATREVTDIDPERVAAPTIRQSPAPERTQTAEVPPPRRNDAPLNGLRATIADAPLAPPIANSVAAPLSSPPLPTPPANTPVAISANDPTPVLTTAKLDLTAAEQSRVEEVLRRYALAYGALDASAAREVWPSVDERALARAFDGLASQSVSFDNCQIDVHGATANASCRGQASYVGKVGRGAPRTEPRTWRFELRRDGETWKIANAEARRTSG
jgi:hypothetical protein